MHYELTEDNFVLYAMKHYDNPSCKGLTEFKDDLKRFSYLKKLFKKYQAGDEPRERLILNHVIVLHNLFGINSIPMLFFKIDSIHWRQLKSFLIYLNIMPPDDMAILQDALVLESLERI